MEADEWLRIGGVGWDDESQLWHILGSDPHTHICVTHVDFGQENGPERRVCCHNVVQQPLKSSPELDRFRRRLLGHGVVEPAECEIINKPRSPAFLGDEPDWADP